MNPIPSAGQALETTSTAPNPIGVYRHPDGHEIGVTDPIMGDAVVRQGFTLHKQYATSAEVSKATARIVEEPIEESGEPIMDETSKKGSK